MRKDAPFMLEWMHDPNVVKYMYNNFSEMTIDDCLSFIDESNKSTENLHLAIVDENDEYLGTVSLKHIIDYEAEFAITIRKKAMGKNISKEAMSQIIIYGFNELNLKLIYWCVDPMNKRAIRFYDKNGYKKISLNKRIFGYTDEQIEHYIWYVVDKG